MSAFINRPCLARTVLQKFCIKETKNLSTHVDSSTDTFFVFAAAAAKRNLRKKEKKEKCKAPSLFLPLPPLLALSTTLATTTSKNTKGGRGGRGGGGGLNNERPQTNYVIWGPMRGLEKNRMGAGTYTYIHTQTS